MALFPKQVVGGMGPLLEAAESGGETETVTSTGIPLLTKDVVATMPAFRLNIGWPDVAKQAPREVVGLGLTAPGVEAKPLALEDEPVLSPYRSPEGKYGETPRQMARLIIQEQDADIQSEKDYLGMIRFLIGKHSKYEIFSHLYPLNTLPLTLRIEEQGLRPEAEEDKANIDGRGAWYESETGYGARVRIEGRPGAATDMKTFFNLLLGQLDSQKLVAAAKDEPQPCNTQLATKIVVKSIGTCKRDEESRCDVSAEAAFTALTGKGPDETKDRVETTVSGFMYPDEKTALLIRDFWSLEKDCHDIYHFSVDYNEHAFTVEKYVGKEGKYWILYQSFLGDYTLAEWLQLAPFDAQRKIRSTKADNRKIEGNAMKHVVNMMTKYGGFAKILSVEALRICFEEALVGLGDVLNYFSPFSIEGAGASLQITRAKASCTVAKSEAASRGVGIYTSYNTHANMVWVGEDKRIWRYEPQIPAGDEQQRCIDGALSGFFKTFLPQYRYFNHRLEDWQVVQGVRGRDRIHKSDYFCQDYALLYLKRRARGLTHEEAAIDLVVKGDAVLKELEDLMYVLATTYRKLYPAKAKA